MNYEAGVKFSRGPVTFNAAAFYNDIKDLQVTADAGSCSSRVVFNAPKAHAKGVEAEVSFRPARGFDLSFAGSIVNAEFDSNVRSADDPLTATNESVIIAGIRDGNRLPTVPKHQFAVTAGYNARLSETTEFFISGSVQRVGNRFTQPGDQEPGAALFSRAIFFDRGTGASGSRSNNFGSLRLPSYTLTDLTGGLSFNRGLEVQVYVKNLFDESPLLSFDRERGGRARLGFTVGQPRTIGVTVRQKFGR